MQLLTQDLRDTLLANFRQQQSRRGTESECDFLPVVKLFTPDAAATWLLTELDEDGDTAFGLCDLGCGFPATKATSVTVPTLGPVTRQAFRVMPSS